MCPLLRENNDHSLHLPVCCLLALFHHLLTAVPAACSTDVMKGGGQKQSQVVFQRALQRQKPVAYQITDKAPAKGSSDWKRVVAVIVHVSGQ